MSCQKERTYIFTCCLSLFFLLLSVTSQAVFHGFSQQLSNIGDSTDVYIKAIKAEYARINSLTNLRIDTLEIDGLSAEGGEYRLYYEGQNLVKVVVLFYGEMGRIRAEYYLKDGNLIFSYQQKEEYDRPIGQDQIKIKSAKDRRYYLHNKRLIHYVDNSGKQSTKEQLAVQEKFILEEWGIMLEEISKDKV